MRILIVTDAWYPQVNGVVRTYDTLRTELAALGHEPVLVTPEGQRTLPMPTYPEIKLSVLPLRAVRQSLEAVPPDAVHIATEGPLGWAARTECADRKWPFTTAFHTKFPEYVHARTMLPVSWGYAVIRKFHRRSAAVMVATQSVADELAQWGVARTVPWTRGCDTTLFRPRPEARDLYDMPRPVFLYVGRVAVEKSVEAFLALDLPGSKLVVGDGPQRAELQERFPAAHFAGVRTGEDLAMHYAFADVLVFPSRTDTFGQVMTEALASGLPVAAHPVPGPRDVLGPAPAEAPVGVMAADLRAAAVAALEIPHERCVAYAARFAWPEAARVFVQNLVPIRG